ncbi:MAG: hypothetical protein WBA13_04735 [Microcoleaceae cyanobacterium]
MKPSNSIIDIFTNPNNRFPIYFIVGFVISPILSEGVSTLFWGLFGNWLQNQFNLSIDQTRLTLVVVTLLTTGIFATIYCIPFLRWLRDLPKRIKPVPPQTRVQQLNDHLPGLILIMSPRRNNEESPAERAIFYHLHGEQPTGLKHCWLICTSKSQQAAKELKERIDKQGFDQTLKLHYGENYIMDDPENPKEKLSLFVPDNFVDDPVYTQKLVNCIYADAEQKYNLDESEIIADFTGGTKSMTAGVVLSGIKPSRRLQYISQLGDCPIMEIKLDYKIKPYKSR